MKKNLSTEVQASNEVATKAAKVKRDPATILHDTAVNLRTVSGKIYAIRREQADKVQDCAAQLDEIGVALSSQ